MKQSSFVLHDETVNTYGFRMLTSGANLEEFRKNPVMLLRHDDEELPIGRWDNIRVEGTRILADPVFDEEDELAMRVKRKVDNGFIRMASIGTWPPEELSDAPELKLEGQTMPTVTRWTVREASIVTIGANHNALAMYDRTTGQRLDLTDASTIVRLMDCAAETTNHIINNDMTKTVKGILNLQDSATDAEVVAAVEALQAANETLAKENATLKAEAEQKEQERRNAQKAQAATLVDAAIKDGRIEAGGRKAYLELFDKDFDNARSVLESIPQRVSVASRIETGKETAGAELSDFAGKTWDELDREGRLIELRDKNPELFREKFKARFGVEYKE